MEPLGSVQSRFPQSQSLPHHEWVTFSYRHYCRMLGVFISALIQTFTFKDFVHCY